MPEIKIANACEAPEGDDGDGRGQNSYSLYRMWLGPYGTQVYVWADSFEDAFEELVEWADDHAPGFLVSIGESELREAAEDLGVEWQEHWLKDNDYDDDFMRVVEHAEMDLTQIGHTTLKNGQYIPSHEWGGDDVDSDSEEYAAVHEASLEECDGDVGYAK